MSSRCRADQATQDPSRSQNTFENNPTVSQQLTLLRGPGSRTVSGNLLTLPSGGGFLYVEPVYVQANAGAGSYPLLHASWWRTGTTSASERPWKTR